MKTCLLLFKFSQDYFISSSTWESFVMFKIILRVIFAFFIFLCGAYLIVFSSGLAHKPPGSSVWPEVNKVKNNDALCDGNPSSNKCFYFKGFPTI